MVSLKEQAQKEASALSKRYNVVYLTFLIDELQKLLKLKEEGGLIKL